MTNKVLFTALPKIVKWAKKDLDKRFSLLEPWRINLVDALPAAFDCSLFHASGKGILFKPYISTRVDVHCDGNTLFPEEILGVPIVAGSLAHDAGYAFLKPFAKAMGWSMYQARLFWDTLYGNIQLELARRLPQDTLRQRAKRRAVIASAYTAYYGVRAFGGITWKAYRVFGVVAVSVAVSGCSGCMGKVIETDFDAPAYRQDNTSVTNAQIGGD